MLRYRVQNMLGQFDQSWGQFNQDWGTPQRPVPAQPDVPLSMRPSPNVPLNPPVPSGVGTAAATGALIGTGVMGLLVLGSIGASAYHGYKRNNSTGWAVWWGLMGSLFPVITPAVAIAQGFGKREKK
jgi:hypothetical protein